jgi:Zn ribbon nucleic-acid-binding protein
MTEPVGEYDSLGFLQGYKCPNCRGTVKFDHKDDVGTSFFKCEKCGQQTSKPKRDKLFEELRNYKPEKRDRPKLRDRCGACAAFRTHFCPWDTKDLKGAGPCARDYACADFDAGWLKRTRTVREFDVRVDNL